MSTIISPKCKQCKVKDVCDSNLCAMDTYELVLQKLKSISSCDDCRGCRREHANTIVCSVCGRFKGIKMDWFEP